MKIVSAIEVLESLKIKLPFQSKSLLNYEKVYTLDSTYSKIFWTAWLTLQLQHIYFATSINIDIWPNVIIKITDQTLYKYPPEFELVLKYKLLNFIEK